MDREQELPRDPQELWIVKHAPKLTLGWLIVSVAVLAVWWPDGDEGVSANKLGDWAAGVFAPLAFLWLLVEIKLQRFEIALTRHSQQALIGYSKRTADAVEVDETQVLAPAALYTNDRSKIDTGVFRHVDARSTENKKDWLLVFQNVSGLDLQEFKVAHWEPYEKKFAPVRVSPERCSPKGYIVLVTPCGDLTKLVLTAVDAHGNEVSTRWKLRHGRLPRVTDR